jgi:hypothetical protein
MVDELFPRCSFYKDKKEMKEEAISREVRK